MQLSGTDGRYFPRVLGNSISVTQSSFMTPELMVQLLKKFSVRLDSIYFNPIPVSKELFEPFELFKLIGDFMINLNEL
jgi:hypothetical protein